MSSPLARGRRDSFLLNCSYASTTSAALVDDLLGAAVARADHLAVGLRVLVDDLEREVLDAVVLDLRIDLALELVAVLAHRLRECRAHRHECQCCRSRS